MNITQGTFVPTSDAVTPCVAAITAISNVCAVVSAQVVGSLTRAVLKQTGIGLVNAGSGLNG